VGLECLRTQRPEPMAGERAPKELRHAVRAGNLEAVKKHVVGGKYKDAISNPKVGSTLLFASAQVSPRWPNEGRALSIFLFDR
jgi:hypothetical protein